MKIKNPNVRIGIAVVAVLLVVMAVFRISGAASGSSGSELAAQLPKARKGAVVDKPTMVAPPKGAASRPMPTSTTSMTP